MQDALARSIAIMAADVLGLRSRQARGAVPDEAIGLYLWRERGIRDQGSLVLIINHTRTILDGRRPLILANDTAPRGPRSLQLSLPLETT